MDTGTDIRAQIAADAHLQTEINHALLAVADTLATGSDRRIVRILTRTLEASWTEHVSFQNEVLFPILAARHGAGVRDRIEQMRTEHAILSQRHRAIGHQLEDMLHGRLADLPKLEELLQTTYEQRRSHLNLDAELHSRLPRTFTEAERSLCSGWSSARHPRFPLNLLRSGGRPFPRLGGRLH